MQGYQTTGEPVHDQWLQQRFDDEHVIIIHQEEDFLISITKPCPSLLKYKVTNPNSPYSAPANTQSKFLNKQIPLIKN